MFSSCEYKCQLVEFCRTANVCVCKWLIDIVRPACLTILDVLDILEIYLNFISTGNPGILLDFCQVSLKFHGAMTFVVIDVVC